MKCVITIINALQLHVQEIKIHNKSLHTTDTREGGGEGKRHNMEDC